MTIMEAIAWGQEQIRATLEQKIEPSIHKPAFDAQVLLAHVLKKNTSYLFAHMSDLLSDAQFEDYRLLIERRKAHEPIAYIIGTKPFYGRDFMVNGHVLIPRPDTEPLIEHAISLTHPESTIIDIGTGSGAIAITQACESNIPVIAIDIDSSALSIARHNAATHQVDHLIEWLQGDLLEPYLQRCGDQSNEDHCLMMANLPYLRTLQWDILDPDVRLFEPEHALMSGIDGLDHYDRLLQQIHDHRGRLPHRIDLLMEIDPQQPKKLEALIRSMFPQAQIQVMNDLSHRARFVHAQI